MTYQEFSIRFAKSRAKFNFFIALWSIFTPWLLPFISFRNCTLDTMEGEYLYKCTSKHLNFYKHCFTILYSNYIEIIPYKISRTFFGSSTIGNAHIIVIGINFKGNISYNLLLLLQVPKVQISRRSDLASTRGTSWPPNIHPLQTVWPVHIVI